MADSKKHQNFIAVVLYAVSIVFIFGAALAPREGLLLFGDDIHRQYYFYRQFFTSYIRQGIFPWWNPYVFSGAPFIANPVVNIWYLPTWLFVVLPLRIAYSWHIAIHILWACVGMYLLLKRWTGNIAAWAGGAVFGLSGFFMARVYAGHVDVIAAASYMPWVFGAFSDVIRSTKKSAYAWAAILFALQLFAGYQTMAFFTGIVVGIGAFLYAVTHKDIRVIGRVLFVAALGAGLAGLQLVPEQEFFRQSIRTFPLPYSWISYGSLAMQSLRQFWEPFPFGDQLTYAGPPPNYAEHAFYMGRVAIIAALLGIASFVFFAWKKKMSGLIIGIVFIFVGLFGLWISLGVNAPVDLQHMVWQIVPMYRYLRIPSRHLILVVFSIAGLAAFGVNRFKYKWVQLILAFLIILELVPYAKRFISVKEMPESRHDKELIEIFSKEKEPYRVLLDYGVWVSPRDSFDFNSAMSYRIFSASGYDPSILRNYYEFIDAANKTAKPSILTHDVQIPFLYLFLPYTNFLNIRHIIVPREFDPLYGVRLPQFVKLREDIDRNYRLYENHDAMPRYFLVPSARVFATREQIAGAIRRMDDLPKDVVYIGQKDSIQLGSVKADCIKDQKADVKLVSYDPNKVILDVNMPCSGFLGSSEVMYPGWKAAIDGKSTFLFEGNLAFRTLYLPQGIHKVEYYFSPLSVVVGGLISVVSAFILLFTLRKRILRVG